MLNDDRIMPRSHFECSNMRDPKPHQGCHLCTVLGNKMCKNYARQVKLKASLSEPIGQESGDGIYPGVRVVSQSSFRSVYDRVGKGLMVEACGSQDVLQDIPCLEEEPGMGKNFDIPSQNQEAMEAEPTTPVPSHETAARYAAKCALRAKFIKDARDQEAIMKLLAERHLVDQVRFQRILEKTP